MYRKAFVYGVVGVLALALVAGTMVILLRPAEAQAGELTRRGGQGQQAVQGATCEDSRERGVGGFGAGADRWDESASQRAAGRSSNTAGQGAPRERSQSYPVSEADHPEASWVLLAGIITEVDGEVTVQSDTGLVVVGLGPEWYREDTAFTVTEGDEVVVAGFYEDGEFKAGTIDNVSTGVSLDLRDETGRPLWAGRGRNAR